MARLRVKRYGTRAEVYHGNRRMTQGRLTKEDLVMNQYGYIVSKSKSRLMKTKVNPLRKKGLLQKKKIKIKKELSDQRKPKKEFLNRFHKFIKESFI